MVSQSVSAADRVDSELITVNTTNTQQNCTTHYKVLFARNNATK